MTDQGFRRFPVGKQDFEQIREGGFVYIDKTRWVWELANRYGDAIFLSRPRRFGKSLLCSTLKHYFLGHRELFKGLAIDEMEKDWTEYPVLHFDMSQVKRVDPADIRLVLSGKLSDFEAVYGVNPFKKTLGDRLEWLVAEAHRQTGQRTVLIIDEYDAPMLNVVDKPEVMEEVHAIFNEFYGPVKSMAEHLRFVFITGITKFSQMSIFSTINNLKNISLTERMEGVCGITAQELEDNFGPDINRMAQKYGIGSDEMMQWLRDRYDGYHFGPALTDVYNPFSLINAFDDLTLSDYWFDSATPSSLIKILNLYPFTLSNIENQTLLSDDFNQPFDNFDSALPVLYQSGYLTIKEHHIDGQDDIYTLGIPNGEVYRGLYRTLMGHYLTGDTVSSNSLIRTVGRAMRADDIDAALTAMQQYMAALPHHLSNKTERDFETIVHVLFGAIGIHVDTEVKSAIGRCDVVMRTRECVYALELKLDGSATVDDALAQIDERSYLIPFWNDPRRKVKVGVVFDRDKRTIAAWKAVRE